MQVILTRKELERIIIGDKIQVTVKRIRPGHSVELVIDVPDQFQVVETENTDVKLAAD